MTDDDLRSAHAGSPRRFNTAWALTKTLLGVAAVAAILLWLAGSITWVWGWVYFVIAAAASLTHTAWLARHNPELLVKRSRGYGDPGTPRWDTVISVLGAGLLPLASWFVAALDERFRWAPEVPFAVHVIGGGALVMGWAIWLWAMFSNRYFASTVRLQNDHMVVTGGPYRWLRHPGYVGLMTYQVATPLLLGSWLALAVASLTVPLIVLRTALEDKWLHEQLPGYRDYASMVRYRLLPRLW